jgi:hypothetical protein
MVRNDLFKLVLAYLCEFFFQAGELINQESWHLHFML